MNQLRKAWMPCLSLAVVLIALPAMAGLETFNGPPAGTVVAGSLPQGGFAPGTTYPGFTLQCANTGGGPDACIVFDSGNPTGQDQDLGSPNGDFGGPGVGSGGEAGMPGQNDTALGNVLIVAEDLGDGNGDNIVDDPDDEAGGGIMIFTFDEPVVLDYVTVMDIDREQAQFFFRNDGALIGTVMANDLGNNSVEQIDLTGFGAVTEFELHFSSSGAIAEFLWEFKSVTTEDATWGGLKVNFSR